MGKTYKSFDKHESFDYHNDLEAKDHKRHKREQVIHYSEVHKDRKKELLNSLPDNHMGSDDWRDRD